MLRNFFLLSTQTNLKSQIKIQRLAMKPKFTLQEYNKVYPTGSNAGKLYGTAKIRKLPELETVD